MEHLHHAHLHRRHVIEEVTTFIQPVERAEIPSVVEIGQPAPVIAARQASQTGKCVDNDPRPQCEKPQGSNALPIALASTLPVVVAIIVFIFLHRRNKKKLALEDLNDKHKSLDFGIDPASKQPGRKGRRGGKGDVEMTMGEKQRRPDHKLGLSLDMNMGSPYLLPAGVNGSRDSLHSLSRSMKDNHDPYGPLTQMSDHPRRTNRDNSSTYTGSSKGTERLLRGASPMGLSMPRRADSIPTPASDQAPLDIKFPEPVHKQDSAISGFPPAPLSNDVHELDDKSRGFDFGSAVENSPLAELEQPAAIGRKPLPQAGAEQPVELPTRESVSSRTSSKGGLPSNPRPARLQSMQASSHNANQSMGSMTSDYGDNFKVTPPSPIVETTIELPPVSVRHSLDAPTTSSDAAQQNPTGLGVGGVELGSKRYSMSIRPLPPDDPTENPEERANRIRSFYREYFDDSKPDPVGHYGDYVDDYAAEYLDGAVFDPDSGQFVMAGAPYAQPVTRRAMTPPPRAPPRFGQGAGHLSSGSSARFVPRGQSAMSARGAPRKPLPPPSTLKSLPTPHLLKDDNNLFTALDFAPPVSYRDRQAGRRPDSPLGTSRPYSPAVRAHTPLASSFTELRSMPSPHLLRKSGTFTGLDFAPNSHLLKTPDSNSDARSFVSTRSGISQMHTNNIRAGAYRVSRIPKEVVGTRDDIMTSLKPRMNLTEAA